MRYHVEHSLEQLTIVFEGYLDFESFIPLKEDLIKLINPQKKPLVFDFTNLEFVGSSGITPFLKTLQALGNELNHIPLYQNVSVEFKRMLESTPGPAPLYMEQNLSGDADLLQS